MGHVIITPKWRNERPNPDEIRIDGVKSIGLSQDCRVVRMEDSQADTIAFANLDDFETIKLNDD